MGKSAVSEPEVKENSNHALTKKEEAKRKLQHFMQEESKLVKGRFKIYDSPGGREKVTCMKYPTPAKMRERGESGGVEPFSKWMTDGEIYEIPLYVARFLNGIDITAEAIDGKINSCAYPVHSFLSVGANLASCQLDERGIPVPPELSKKYKRRFGFESLEFGV